ncbi:MAG: hypothetical protein J6Y00_07335 [Paludibacteraceae bacterium]|nr:hypothetical protein [Paludibacteraceae bacterium]
MKKILFFAAAIAAGTLVFTACNKKDGNTPDDKTQNPSDYNYAGQKWRIDSCKVEGQLEHGPHALIDILSNNQVIFNGSDTTTYAFDSDKLLIHSGEEHPMELTIKKAEAAFAILDMDHMELYLSRIPESNGKKVDVTADNLIGKWHWDWYYNEYYHYVSEWEKWYTDYNIGTTFGVETWEFRADGTLVKSNSYNAMMGAESQTVWWVLDGNRLAMGFDNQKPEKLEDIPAGYWVNVLTLTDNVFYYGTEEHSQYDEGYQIHKWYLSKVK